MRMGSEKAICKPARRLATVDFAAVARDQCGHAGGGDESAAKAPELRIRECPEDAANVDDNDKADEQAEKKMHLGVNTAGADIVLDRQVVAVQKRIPENERTPDGEPAHEDNQQNA